VCFLIGDAVQEIERNIESQQGYHRHAGLYAQCPGQYFRFDDPHFDQQLADRVALDLFGAVMLFYSEQGLVVDRAQCIQYLTDFFPCSA
jgi:hypothetical protein